MHQVAGGTVVKGSKEVYEKKEPRSIYVSLNRVNEIIGMPIERERVVKSLQSLDIPVVKREKEGVTVAVPAFRHDLNEYMDIIEEVARVIGYENVPATVPIGRLMSARQQKAHLHTGTTKEYFVSSGFFEAVNFGFFSERDVSRFLIPEEDERRQCVTILNPISQEMGVMRTLLAPGLIESLAYNVNRGARSLKMFEVGKVFFKAEPLPKEPVHAACVLTGRERDYFWKGAPPEMDYFDLKGAIEGLIECFGLSLEVQRSEEPFLTRYNASDLFVAGTRIGWAGELRQDVLAAYGIEQKVFAAEVDLGALVEHGTQQKKYQSIPRYPSVVRDFSFVIGADTPVGTLMEKIRSVSPLIVSVGVFDLFRREQVSVAFRVTFQSLEETLRDETVNQLQAIIIQELTRIDGVKLRS